MLKKCLGYFSSLLLLVFVSSNLLAQAPTNAPLTENDVKAYVAFSKLSTAADQAKFMTDGKVDPVAFNVAMAKLSFILNVKSLGQSEAQEKTMLTSNPALPISDADLALVKSHQAELLEAYKALTVPKK
ncbi:MAG: hypothetical protein LBI10_10395 [Deltaproteobacteria bacterium]|jgi:hypothetical protein|nr:hypothetical protein [Deltaproteobacteria bacterium]